MPNVRPCGAYIDTEMVRAGVASHPSMWPFCGYNEIQEPRRKNVLINHKRLQELLGAGSYDQMKERHQGWVAEYCGGAEKGRKDDWTASIAAGSKGFVDRPQDPRIIDNPISFGCSCAGIVR